MNNKFELKNVTIVIDQNVKRFDCYYLRADKNSPLSSAGSADEVSSLFAQWLTNTLNAMSANDCSKIVMKILWE